MGPERPVRASLTALPVVRQRPSARATVALLAAVALPRVVAFFVNENLHGDAVARTDLALRWAENPHWISSFNDGAFQFGPLHLYAIGLALKVWPDVEHAGRLVSLVFGVLTVIPLRSLSWRLFGENAARWACLALAAWGLHVQISTTAASEALGVFLMLSVLALFAQGLDEGRFAPLTLSALALNLACAVRYDAWMLAPLLVLMLWMGDRDRVASTTRAILYGLLCLPFPMLWLHGNELATGDPLFPIRYIDDYHVRWFERESAFWGPSAFRLYNAVFWPGVALVTLTPLVGVLGAAGMVRAWRERPQVRWLIWVAAAPTLYFAIKGALLVSFVPLARFAVNQLIILLPFVWFGFEWVARPRGPVPRRLLAWATVASAVLVAGGTTVAVLISKRGFARSLAPASAISLNPREVMAVARYLAVHTPVDRRVLIDRDPRYMDLQIAFFSRLPRPHAARAPQDPAAPWRHAEPPEYVVVTRGGVLEKHPSFAREEGGRVRLYGFAFLPVPGFGPPYELYRRDPR